MSSAYFLVLGVIFCSEMNWVCSHFSSIDHTEEEHQQMGSTLVPPVSDHRFFLHEIFTKYGHDGQMTFEGFEHLLESLGLGNIIISDHDVEAHKENPHANIHETHDHTKKIDHIDVTTPKTPLGKEIPDRVLNGSSATSAESSMNRQNPTHFTPLSPTAASDSTGTTHRVQYQKVNAAVSSNTNRTTMNVNHINDNLYHYRLKEVKIPELLVNISSLVDQHRELENRSPEIVIEQCLSPREILEAFGINQTSSLNPVSFLHLCPAIIYELDQGHCLYKQHSHNSVWTMTILDQWLFSSLAVIIISLCGLLSVAVIPIMQKWFYHTLLQFLVGLAVGSLSGDALLHLLPHAMLGEEDNHQHRNPISAAIAEKAAVWRGFAALFGIFFFFIAERLLAAYASYRKQKYYPGESDAKDVNPTSEEMYNGNVGEKLSQYRKSSYTIEPNGKEMIKMLEAGNFGSRKPSCDSLHNLELNFNVEPNLTVVYAPTTEPSVTKHGHGHSHEVPDSISAVAWMVIMGDGLHNFCDGLAIGTAFASGIEGGISTAVAVFCHELPHELGDFAMLLKTGMKVKQALLYNGLSSILCFLGMIIGVSLGNVHSATSWVFAATAGMFLYIALVDMLPELSSSTRDSNTPTYLLAVQVLGMSCGASIMLLIANFEQDLRNIIS